MIALLILLCIINLLILIAALALALSHKRLIDYITRRFYDIELKLQNND